jgi:ABC-type branched-subunit amino acid transport system substrate-binding protein
MSGKRNGFRLALVLMVTSTLGAAGTLTATAASSTATTPVASAATASLVSTSSNRCPGPDITIGQIVTATGQSEAFPDVPIAAKVAVHAVNDNCAAGHPLKLVTCDDQDDADVSVTCAHTLVSDGVVAMVGNSSTELSQAMAVTQAAGIPSLFNAGSTPWELTNALSYPLVSVVVQALGAVTAAKGSGSKSLEILGPDVPAASATVGLLTTLAKANGITLIPVLYPPSTTDFAPVAAEALSSNPGAIVVPSGGSQTDPLFEALSQQGVAAKTILMAPSGLFSPAAVKQLGKAVNGVYIESGTALPVDATGRNSGITQMRKEYVADGQNPSNSNMTSLAVDAWSAVHTLATVLKGMTKVTAASVNTGLLALGKVTEAQIPTFNLSTNALSSISAVSAFRILSNSLIWYKVEKGKFVLLTHGFVPVAHPFNLKHPAA